LRLFLFASRPAFSDGGGETGGGWGGWGRVGEGGGGWGWVGGGGGN
jgi:hypothetical protein